MKAKAILKGKIKDFSSNQIWLLENYIDHNGEVYEVDYDTQTKEYIVHYKGYEK